MPLPSAFTIMRESAMKAILPPPDDGPSEPQPLRPTETHAIKRTTAQETARVLTRPHEFPFRGVPNCLGHNLRREERANKIARDAIVAASVVLRSGSNDPSSGRPNHLVQGGRRPIGIER